MKGLRRAVLFVFYRLGRAAERFGRLTDYVAIGARQISDMQRDTHQVWQAFYLNYPTHDSRLMAWEDEFVTRFVKPGSSILVIGCGSGRDVIPLVEREYRVTGIDPVASALDHAKRILEERQLAASLIEGFFEDTPISGTFDTIIFSYYCYSYVPRSARRVAMLKKAVALLRCGGRVVISHDSRTPRPHAWLVRVARLSGAINRSDWRLEPGDLVWNNRQSQPSYSFTHAFEVGELEREAAAAGLSVVFRRAAEDATIVAVLGRP
jgi:SAM-dependent methyltransferase